ncbi:MAG: gliding motility-associated C-terminal domain-containing protein [Candidatus Wallbacteria bacterium]|nr:gliding motility-associated C-terminal domain-containing protein [Candidatus Wallbacteria bacterium]
MRRTFFLFLLFFFVNSAWAASSMSLITTKTQVSLNEVFYIDINLSSVEAFQKLAFTLEFDKTHFEGQDNCPDIPNSGSDGQMALGTVFGNEYNLVANTIKNTDGKITFSIEDSGVGKISMGVQIARAKFKCISSDVGHFTFTLSGITVNTGTTIANVTKDIWIGSQSITSIGLAGGTATGPGGLTLTFPVGAVLSNTSISIVKVTPASIPNAPAFPSDSNYASTAMAWQMTPEMYFKRPVTLTINYSTNELGTADEKYLKLYWLNPALNSWVRIGGESNSTTKIVKWEIMHFSYFLLVSDKFKAEHIRITDDKAIPNPFSPNGNSKSDWSTISFHISKDAKESTVKIYDINGRLIRLFFEKKALLKGEIHVEWDGKNDYTEIVPTGIYIYYIGVRDYDDRLDEKKRTIVVSKKME